MTSRRVPTWAPRRWEVSSTVAFNHKHLIDITEYSEEDIKLILETAKAFSEVNERAIKKVPTVKGESLVDTVETLNAYKIDCIVVRDKHAGAPYIVTQNSPASVICAGDGKHNHPTQALLDLYTIWEHKGDFHGLKVAVVGDISHSRVCGSLIPALKIMGCETYAVAPGTLLPPSPEVLGCDHVTSDLDSVLPELDVVYMLRVQQERLEGAPFPTIREYHKLFGLTKDREKLMKPDAIICHPGPINRGVEFDSYMADHPQRSVILEQVYAGICVRMAILYLLLGGADNGLAS